MNLLLMLSLSSRWPIKGVWSGIFVHPNHSQTTQPSRHDIDLDHVIPDIFPGLIVWFVNRKSDNNNNNKVVYFTIRDILETLLSWATI